MGKWQRTGTVRPAGETRRPPEPNNGPLIEPSADEARNGWTAETLTKYLAERDQAASNRIINRPVPKPVRARNAYNPVRWRG